MVSVLMVLYKGASDAPDASMPPTPQGNHKGLPLRKTAYHVGAILYGCPGALVALGLQPRS